MINRATEDDVDLKDAEALQTTTRAHPTHYEPATEDERALDKRVNRKMDFIVLSLLAIEFIVGPTPAVFVSN